MLTLRLEENMSHLKDLFLKWMGLTIEEGMIQVKKLLMFVVHLGGSGTMCFSPPAASFSSFRRHHISPLLTRQAKKGVGDPRVICTQRVGSTINVFFSTQKRGLFQKFWGWIYVFSIVDWVFLCWKLIPLWPSEFFKNLRIALGFLVFSPMMLLKT